MFRQSLEMDLRWWTRLKQYMARMKHIEKPWRRRDRKERTMTYQPLGCFDLQSLLYPCSNQVALRSWRKHEMMRTLPKAPKCRCPTAGLRKERGILSAEGSSSIWRKAAGNQDLALPNDRRASGRSDELSLGVWPPSAESRVDHLCNGLEYHSGIWWDTSMTQLLQPQKHRRQRHPHRSPQASNQVQKPAGQRQKALQGHWFLEHNHLPDDARTKWTGFVPAVVVSVGG